MNKDITIKPFIKWAGGKQQLLTHLIKNVPSNFNCYYEPFVGSGALFFGLKPKEAVISDVNSELVNCYLSVKNTPDELISLLKTHINTPEYFYKVRATKTEGLNNLERASRFLYLNRTCFNGLYRENKLGQFNVPFGKYKNPDIAQEIKIKNASIALKNTKIIEADYKKSLKKAKKGDFIYLDPPYYPLGGYSDFKRYHKVFFERKDHEELASLFELLDKRGCYLMLSNSDTEFTRSLYNKWNLKTLMAKRLINCDATKRGQISEILVTNY